MSKICGHTVPCGCGDQPLMTPPPCDETGPCAGEPCAELFCEECLIHCQPDITVEIEEGATLTITQGMRFDAVIQTFMIAMRDPSCLGISVVGLQQLAKTSTTITIKWIPVTGETYEIFWQEGLNIYSAVVTDVSQYQIINLIPDTTYTIKIVTDGTACESVTMTIKTNAT